MDTEIEKFRALQEQAKTVNTAEQLGEPHPDEQRSVLHKLHRTQEQPAAEKQNRSHKNEQEL